MESIDHKQKLLIEMVMRQTNYTFDEAKIKLKEYDNNYMRVIKEALGINVTKKSNVIESTNQAIYKEIRNLMDDASNNYRKNQEMERKREELIEKIKKKSETKKNLETLKEEEEDNN